MLPSPMCRIAFLLAALALGGCAATQPSVGSRVPQTLVGVNDALKGVDVRLQLTNGVLYPRARVLELGARETTFFPDGARTEVDTVATADVQRIFLPRRANREGGTGSALAGAVPGLVLATLALTRPRQATGPAEGFIEEGGRVILVVGSLVLAGLGAAVGASIARDRQDGAPTVLYRAPVERYLHSTTRRTVRTPPDR